MKIASATLTEENFLTVDVLWKNNSAISRQTNVLLFRFAGQLYAYVNHCMHMHRPLNCQENAIFDSERRWLRCSMHGFIFEPRSGACLSPVCAGQSLQALKVLEQNGLITFTEKHCQVLAVHQHGKNTIEPDN